MFEADAAAGSSGTSGTARGYVRFAALGDSATHGLGDPVDGGWRGWARLLSEAISVRHHVSCCNLAVSGATVADVRRDQLEDALAHAPHLAALIVGLNDTLRSTWDDDQVREDLLHCADALAARGAVLMIARFHHHGRVLRLPGMLSRPLAHRIAPLNATYDEIAERHETIRVDLSAIPEVYDRRFWSVDRMHPSELGHRLLARRFAALLEERGLPFEAPSLECSQAASSAMENVRWMLAEGAPWLGRRARDLGPALARTAFGAARARLAG